MRFIFVDKILELDPGKNIYAIKQISATEDFFQDHFPGFPVVPGVLLTEMMAQTAGKCLDAEKHPRGKAMLARILSASFRQWMLPDQTAYIYAQITANQDKYAKADCYIEVAGEKICTAELFFSFVPAAQFAPEYKDKVLEEFLRRK